MKKIKLVLLYNAMVKEGMDVSSIYDIRNLGDNDIDLILSSGNIEKAIWLYNYAKNDIRELDEDRKKILLDCFCHGSVNNTFLDFIKNNSLLESEYFFELIKILYGSNGIKNEGVAKVIYDFVSSEDFLEREDALKYLRRLARSESVKKIKAAVEVINNNEIKEEYKASFVNSILEGFVENLDYTVKAVKNRYVSLDKNGEVIVRYIASAREVYQAENAALVLDNSEIFESDFAKCGEIAMNVVKIITTSFGESQAKAVVELVNSKSRFIESPYSLQILRVVAYTNNEAIGTTYMAAIHRPLWEHPDIIQAISKSKSALQAELAKECAFDFNRYGEETSKIVEIIGTAKDTMTSMIIDEFRNKFSKAEVLNLSILLNVSMLSIIKAINPKTGYDQIKNVEDVIHYFESTDSAKGEDVLYFINILTSLESEESYQVYKSIVDSRPYQLRTKGVLSTYKKIEKYLNTHKNSLFWDNFHINPEASMDALDGSCLEYEEIDYKTMVNRMPKKMVRKNK